MGRKPSETFEQLLDIASPGDSLEALADRLGVAAKTLYNLRNGAVGRPTRGTVALIAWAEFIETKGFSHFKDDQSPTVALVVGSLFAAVIGSVSFWGSLVAFAKLQENIIPKGVEMAFVKHARLFQAANIVLLLAAVAAGLSALCYAELSSSIPVSG